MRNAGSDVFANVVEFVEHRLGSRFSNRLGGKSAARLAKMIG